MVIEGVHFFAHELFSPILKLLLPRPFPPGYLPRINRQKHLGYLDQTGRHANAAFFKHLFRCQPLPLQVIASA
jgi:hypothetical protein